MKCGKYMVLRALLVLSIAISAHAHAASANMGKQKLAADNEHTLSGRFHGWRAPQKRDGLLGGVILGCLCWCICPCALWNTERISVKQAKMRLKAERYAVHIDDVEREPPSEMNGRIVYITGTSTCSDTLADDVFTDVKSEGKIRLRRKVEMYQWVEHEHTHEEGPEGNRRTVTTYTYTQEWRDDEESCPNASDKNNKPFPFPSTRRQEPYQAWATSGAGANCVTAAHEKIRLGAYYLGDNVIRELCAWEDKTDLTKDMLARSDLDEPKKDDDGWWYYGRGLGDMRVRFEVLNTGPITICGVLVKNETGWSFVPIINQTAVGAGDSLMAECGKSCCFSVEELHLTEEDEDADKQLLEALQDRPKEIEAPTLVKFKKSGTTQISSYQPEDDMEDLCCIGPFASLVVQAMHWLGMEDELLAVAEEQKSLQKTIDSEKQSMETKVMLARLLTFLGMMFGTHLIIEPIMKLLNYNIWVSMLGGALLSCMICCCAMACTCAAYCCITSTAWLFYRPFLSIIGFGVTILSIISVVYIVDYADKQLQGSQQIPVQHPAGGPSHGFLAVRHTLSSFAAFAQHF